MMDTESRFSENPFDILELEPGCSRAEIERAGTKLLGLLEVGVSQAQVYRTLLGVRARTPQLVRRAMGQLRDPDQRIVFEFWTVSNRGVLDIDQQPSSKSDEAELPRAQGLLQRLGWSR